MKDYQHFKSYTDIWKLLQSDSFLSLLCSTYNLFFISIFSIKFHSHSVDYRLSPSVCNREISRQSISVGIIPFILFSNSVI